MDLTVCNWCNCSIDSSSLNSFVEFEDYLNINRFICNYCHLAAKIKFSDLNNWRLSDIRISDCNDCFGFGESRNNYRSFAWSCHSCYGRGKVFNYFDPLSQLAEQSDD